MSTKKVIGFMAGLLFALIFFLNTGAFGYLPSGDTHLITEKGAEHARLPSEVVFIDPAGRPLN